MSCISRQTLKFSPKVHLWAKSVSRNGISTLIDGRTKFPYNRTNVLVCGQLYRQFKERGWKRYKDAPEEGIVAQVEYYDNKYIVGDTNASSILLLPGMDSGFDVLKPVIDFFNNQGVRLICPKFPELSLTRSCKYFRHSPQEKAELVKALLQETGVNNFDLLASHSSGNYVGVKLWKDPEGPTVRSFAWLNPAPPEPVVPMQPYGVIKWLLKRYQTPSGRYLIDKVLVKWLKAMGNPYVENSIDTIVLGAFGLHYAHAYKMRKLPMILAFGDNDKIVTKKMNRKMLQHLGVGYDEADIYDKDANLSAKGSCPEWMKVLRFTSGGHFSHLKYPDIVNEAIGQQLKRVPQFTTRKIPDTNKWKAHEYLLGESLEQTGNFVNYEMEKVNQDVHRI